MNTISLYLKGSFILFVVWCNASLAFAQDQDSTCVDAISKAEQAYFNIKFDEAISILEPCVDQIELPNELQDAYLLLARVHFSTQNVSASQEAIHELLSVDDAYSLPPFLPPPFIQFFNDIYAQYTQHFAIAEKLRPAPEYTPPSVWQKIDRHWYWVGGSLIAASAAAFLTNGDSGPTSFAAPPGPPGGETTNQ